MNKGRSMVWPVILILAGVVFLLNNLGIVSVDLWKLIANFWPVIFIIAGIDLLFFNRGNIGSYIGVALIFGVIAIAAWSNDRFDSNFQFGERISVPIFHKIDNVDSVDMVIEIPIGELNIESLDGEGILIDGKIAVGENESYTDSVTIVGDSALYRLVADGPNNPSSWGIGNNFSNVDLAWDLALTENLPLDLRISTGVSESNIDLTNMDIIDFSFDGGVGETIVTFPSTGSFDANVEIGVGAVKIYLPEDLLVRIITSVGIGDVSVKGDYFHDGDGRYVSENFDDRNGVTLYIDGGIGELRIIQIP
jgi:hypothetical protein